MEELIIWVDYPENKPQQSGKYVVNIDNDDLVKNDLAHFDTEKSQWFRVIENKNEEQQPLDGVNAYNPYKIIPYIQNKQQ